MKKISNLHNIKYTLRYMQYTYQILIYNDMNIKNKISKQVHIDRSLNEELLNIS